MSTVCVLMSTYNGEKYLKEQLDSVLSQKNVELNVVIRDDGSKDRTIEIIKNYVKDNSNIRLITGNNIGPALSFLELLKEAPETEYYAFCDQDDYWKEDKLYKAVLMINNNEFGDLPALYYSNLTLTDEKLNIITKTSIKYRSNKKTDRYIPLVDNMGTGCTMVMNKKLAELIISHMPNDITMHDAWCNIVCSLFGNVIFDTNSYIMYRQHNNNTIGMDVEKSITENAKMHLSRIKDTSLQPRFKNAASLWDCFGDELSKEDKEKIYEIISYKDSLFRRFRLLFDFSIHSYSFIKDIKYRLLILFGEI